MHGEELPAPHERVGHPFDAAAHALRLVVEVDLAPTDKPSREEATHIMADAIGAATLEGLQGKIQHVGYRPGDQRPRVALELPFPDDTSPVELPTSKELSPREQGMIERFGLSVREVQVLRLVAHGQKNASIGRALEISEDTVKTHMRRIFGKVRANDRAHAVAIVNNIVPQPPKKPDIPKKKRPKRKEGENFDDY